MSSKRQNKSLLTPLKPVSFKKAKLPLSPKFLTISINMLRMLVSRVNHGTQSSSYSLKLHQLPPSNPINHQSRPLLIFAIKSLIRLLKAEKLKEKITNTGQENIILPEPPFKIKLMNLQFKSLILTSKLLLLTRELPTVRANQLNRKSDLEKNQKKEKPN